VTLLVILRKEILNNYETALKNEWILNNKFGAYSSSTPIFANSRRYHGLFVIGVTNPFEKRMLVNKLEEELIIQDDVYGISVNQYPGTIYPAGHLYMEEFKINEGVNVKFNVNGVKLERNIYLLHDKNTVIVKWILLHSAGKKVKLKVRPLLSFRSIHHLLRSSDNLELSLSIQEKLAIISEKFEENPLTLYIANNSERFYFEGYWYHNFEYDKDKERGYEFREDLFSHGYFEFKFKATQNPVMIFSTEPIDIKYADELIRTEKHRYYKKLQHSEKLSEWEKFYYDLSAKADDFIVEINKNQYYITAGFHWLNSWSSYAMLALPGLSLSRNKYSIAHKLLLTYANYIENAEMPVYFDENLNPSDNKTIGAPLLFINAVNEYFIATKKQANIKEFLYIIKEILSKLIEGKNNARLVKGMLFCGDGTSSISWIADGLINRPATTRYGFTVELEALFYNALKIAASILNHYGEKETALNYETIAGNLKTEFEKSFFNPESNYLFDFINESEKNESITPNAIMACALPYPLVNEEIAKKILIKIKQELLTPVGLRTLPPSDKNYIGAYEGDVKKRDSSYCQGTVWPCFMGLYADLYMRIYKNKEELTQLLLPLKNHFYNEGCFLGINEIFDGDAPHTPRGAATFSATIAELLRILKKYEI